MNKPLFLFVGKSASGKTSVANMLKNKGYSQIYSYTTRAPRYDGEIGHVFISDEEYDKLENIVASTLYNGYRYCTTLEQVQDADIYVVDVPGVETLMSNYNKLNRKVYVIYFSANVYNRIKRMLDRNDSDNQIVARLLNDETEDWVAHLLDLNHNDRFNFTLRTIDANCDLNDVYKEVKELIETNSKN